MAEVKDTSIYDTIDDKQGKKTYENLQMRGVMNQATSEPTTSRNASRSCTRPSWAVLVLSVVIGVIISAVITTAICLTVVPRKSCSELDCQSKETSMDQHTESPSEATADRGSCRSSPCQNEGTCRETYTCVCSQGYTGDRCQQQVEQTPVCNGTELESGCYIFLTDEIRDWFVSQEVCKARGARLLSIDSEMEQMIISQYIFNLPVRCSIDGFHFGLNRLAGNGFVWSHSSQHPTKIWWGCGQPDPGSTASCGAISAYSKYAGWSPGWHDVPCHYNTYAICEFDL